MSGALVGDDPLQDLAAAIDVKSIGVTSAGHQGGAEAINGPDDGNAAPATHRIGAEGNPRNVGTHQALDEYGGGTRCRRQVVFAAVGQNPFAEAGAPDRGDSAGDFIRWHSQKAVHLAGKGVFLPILIGRGGAHGHGSAVGAEFADGATQFGDDFRCGSQEVDGGADRVGAGGIAQGGILWGRQAGLEGGADQHKPGWDGQTRLAQRRQRPGLASQGSLGVGVSAAEDVVRGQPVAHGWFRNVILSLRRRRYIAKPGVASAASAPRAAKAHPGT